VTPQTADGADCDEGWVAKGNAPPDFVGVEVGHRGAAFGRIGPEREDTPLPLDADAIGVTDPESASPYDQELSVTIGSDPNYYVRVWAGTLATEDDLDLLREAVAAISWPDPGANSRRDRLVTAAGDPNIDTFTACMGDRGYSPGRQLETGVKITGGPWADLVWAAGDQARSSYDDDFEDCAQAAQDAVDRLMREFSPWPKTSGPSQTSADAERDGVVPAVAQLPLGDRASPTTWADAADGTWALTQMPEGDGAPGDADGCLGDRTGRYGVAYVCADEYGEVVLVDPASGALLRSYPLPGMVPTWMLITPDAVYAGRQGDGGLPDSAIIRIDRSSLEAEVAVLPIDDGTVRDPSDLGTLDPTAMGWRTATPDERVRSLVGSADLPGGTLVSSWTGVTAVDLPAVEELFA